jgi:hypothetical protein
MKDQQLETSLHYHPALELVREQLRMMVQTVLLVLEQQL